MAISCSDGKVNKLSEDSPNYSRNFAFEDEQTRAKVDSLMAKMTLDDKIVQLCGIRPSELLDENRKFSIEKCREKIPNGIGHVSQFASSMGLMPEDLRDFVNGVRQFVLTETPSHIPVIFHEECITGFTTLAATTFPQHIGTACSWNPALIEEKAALTAQTMRGAGSAQALSPMLDVCKTPYFERMEEGFGEDGYLTSRLGLAFINGLQREGFSRGVAATAKHYAGYAGIFEEKEFFEETLMPFEVVLRLGGVKSVMPGYHKYKDINCVGSKELLTDILRGSLGFDGVIVSDYNAIDALGEGKDAAVQSMNAGADIELPMPDRFLFLKEALAEGLVTPKRLDESVRRALTLKVRLGLFDENPQISTNGKLDFDPPAHREMAYKLATQSVVLLKNNGILPLEKEIKKIALVGPNAGAVQSLLGDYTYQSMSAFFFNTPIDLENPHLVTLLEGLKNRLPEDVQLEYERGCVWNKLSEIQINAVGGDPILKKAKAKEIKGLPVPDEKRAIRIASESDLVIVAVGENVFLSGEGRNRNTIRLPEEQEVFVRKMLDTGKPVILIIFGGRPLYITDFERDCAAIIHAWYPGEEGGNAVSDILTGKVNPSGKLCMTYPKDESHSPHSYNYGYNETDNNPLYPFGYGLSYTAYSYDGLTVKDNAKINDQWIDISFSVKNTGEKEGTEIVQLYIAPENLSVKGKRMQLKGFTRVELNPGESKQVNFRLSPQQLAYYFEKNWVIESGKYKILVGASSSDIRLEKEITLSGNKLILPRRDVFFSEILNK
ncbi:beta-glucosidase [Bacteroidia bacterium]|nr:beta-glucosidase [Bacteroidia bacterium]